MIRAAALGMTPDDVAVGVLSLASVGLAALRGTAEVLLIECSAPELDFFARELQAHLPVRVAKVLLKDLATTVRRQARPGHWAAAVTSFGHLPEVERRLDGLGVPGARAPGGGAPRDPPAPGSASAQGRGSAWSSAAVETAHTLEHSIAAAALPEHRAGRDLPGRGRVR